jgi:hypothetical protein
VQKKISRTRVRIKNLKRFGLKVAAARDRTPDLLVIRGATTGLLFVLGPVRDTARFEVTLRCLTDELKKIQFRQ